MLELIRLVRRSAPAFEVRRIKMYGTLLAIWNGLVFLVYAADKLSARRGGRRAPEATLLWMAAVLGAPGALAAIWLTRHKTQKARFRYGVPVLLLLQAAAWWEGRRRGLW